MTSSLPAIILQQQGIEYALCDEKRRVLEHSPGLPSLLAAEAASAPLTGQRLEDLFDELKGVEAELERVARGELALFRIAYTHHPAPNNPSRYLTLTVRPMPPGLLLIAADTTQEAELAQRLMQERNEVKLLQSRLRQTNERLDYLLRRFVPTGVAQQLMAQRDLPRLGGQRRVISVLFADIRGYTSLAETMEPETVMDLLNRHFAALGRLVVEHGGTLNQYSGDMIMAIFNAPDDQPDHALRAVRAALEMQSLLQAGAELRDILDEPGRPWSGFDLPTIAQFGIGVNTGPAVAGYLGFEDRFDYTAIGDTTNVGARLSAAAQAGQVLIGPHTYEAVRDHIRTRPLGPLKLKGKARPVMVYQALAPWNVAEV